MPKSDTAIVMKSWVEAFSGKMYLWTLYKTNSKETAEDLVQDTFLAAFQSIEKFEGRSEPKTWLFSILNNKIAEHFRKAYRNPTINESDRSVDTEVSLFDTFFDSDGNWKKEQRPTAMCKICADICDACADECSKHENSHCKECAEACRRCAEECRRMEA